MPLKGARHKCRHCNTQEFLLTIQFTAVFLRGPSVYYGITELRSDELWLWSSKTFKAWMTLKGVCNM